MNKTEVELLTTYNSMQITKSVYVGVNVMWILALWKIMAIKDMATP